MRRLLQIGSLLSLGILHHGCSDGPTSPHNAESEVQNAVAQAPSGTIDCDCASARNHGQYVSCVGHAANALVSSGAITAAQRRCVMALAAHSNCGKRGGAVTPDFTSCGLGPGATPTPPPGPMYFTGTTSKNGKVELGGAARAPLAEFEVENENGRPLAGIRIDLFTIGSDWLAIFSDPRSVYLSDYLESSLAAATAGLKIAPRVLPPINAKVTLKACKAFDVVGAGIAVIETVGNHPSAGTALKVARAADKGLTVADKTLDAARTVSNLDKGEEVAKGGTYVLRNLETNIVEYVGRTKDLARRQREHFKDLVKGKLRFEVDVRSNNYAVQRGREQIIYKTYNPKLNLRRPISPSNPRRQEYLRAAARDWLRRRR